MAIQPPLPLKLGRRSDYSRDSFVPSVLNAAALQALDDWSSWRNGVLVLVGSKGSGKTHLAAAWAEQTGARRLTPAFGEAELANLDGPVVLDDADQSPRGEAMFHLINIAARPGRPLLATASTPPNQWSVEVSDLRSRLNALQVAELHEPDDAMMKGLLRRFFEKRGLRPADKVLDFLALRIERSAPKAREVVDILDAAALARRRSVTVQFAGEVLGHAAPPLDADRGARGGQPFDESADPT